jgi:hypothetical protein
MRFLFFIFFLSYISCSQSPKTKSIELEKVIKKNKITLLYIYNSKCSGAKSYISALKDFDTFKNGTKILFINCGNTSLNHYKNIKEICTDHQPIVKIPIIEKHYLNQWLELNLKFSSIQKDSIFWNWPLIMIVDKNSNVRKIQPDNFINLVEMMN